MSKRLIVGLGVVAGVVASSGCATSGTDPAGWYATPPVASGKGRLAVELVDAPTVKVSEINVTISQVTAHAASVGWVEVMSGPAVTVDLLKLKDHAMALGFADLPTGKVTQIRLFVDAAAPNHVVLPSGEQVPLKVPSGEQSGIKIKGPFEVSACATTLVTLDFDGHKSIWVHPTGQDELWILRPVIHAKQVVQVGDMCADAGSPSGSPSPDGGLVEEGGGQPSGGGSPCTEASQCLSNVCAAASCVPSGPRGACVTSRDCASGSCLEDGTCESGGTKPAGASCASSAECLSGSCESGICDVGGQGAACAEPRDCAFTLRCDQGTCGPIIN